MSGYLGVDVVNEGKYYFVSYNTEDMDRVTDYVRSLAGKGLPMWYDYGIQVGNEWEEVIAERIIGSEAVILFISRKIFEKEKSFVHKEYRVATRRKKKIFVVLLDKIEIEEIPPRYEMWWDDIMQLQCIIAPNYSVGECADKLIGELGFVPPRKERDKPTVEKGKGIPLRLLNAGASGGGEAERIAYEVEQVFRSKNLDIRVSEIKQGPSYYRYYLDVNPKTMVRKIKSCKTDIELAIERSGVVISYETKPSSMFVEVPKKHRAVVYLADILESRKFADAKPGQLLFAVGEDVEGSTVVFDMCRMPHLLIGGAPGSGKSVQINAILLSFLMKYTPDQLKLLLIDPKKIEFSVYRKVPHLLDNRVVTDTKEGIDALKSLHAEMERRYLLFEKAGVRQVDDYNAKMPDGEKLPKIVAVIGEFADFMAVSKKEFESVVIRLAQIARASGIYLILATQRPSTDVISGLIKANIPSRIAFRTTTAIESRAILDTVGAENLIGNGDLLYSTIGMFTPLRCQGAFVTDDEVEAIVEYVCEYYKD